MAKRSHNAPTTEGLPKRRRGGQELPDNVQDRPEQNAGYDAAVRTGGTGTPIESHDDADIDDLGEGPTDAKLREEDV